MISLFILTTILHLNFIKIEPNDKWLKVINKYCETISYNLFDNESYRKTSKVFLFVGSLVGVYLENQIMFKNNHKHFLEYSMNSKYRFSNTSVDKSLCRIIIMMITYLIFLNFFFKDISDFKTDSFAYITVTTFIIPYIIYGISIFFMLKIIMKYLGLTNELIFNPLSDLYNPLSIDKYKNKSFKEELESADTKISMELINDEMNEPLLK